MIRPPAAAWLDNRWNQALDLAAEVPVSPSKVAAVWDAQGPDRVLATLRRLAGDGTAAEAGDAAWEDTQRLTPPSPRT